MQTIEADIAVIGAGIIGASCAYHCAKRGLKVALIDAGVPAGGTSGACDGYVAVSSKKPGLVMELALESKRLYPHLVRVLPRDVEYRETGGMLLVEDAADMDKLGAHVATLPPAVIRQLLKHPLTDTGLAQFVADYKKAFGG